MGDFHPVVDSVYKIEEVQDAYNRIEQGDMIGKIVISL
ncbi:zinc-binding dehydrogenase [Rhizosphaericola mali]|uniref:Zinc-binding dehydrogenase n=1 Tax=Rhizosphaericola mali TaxID=2545455 RepID=A0A5P2GBA1_9BACT|nr:zinc-binding dehydrogenase [Rhizosphaericola mali]